MIDPQSAIDLLAEIVYEWNQPMRGDADDLVSRLTDLMADASVLIGYEPDEPA